MAIPHRAASANQIVPITMRLPLVIVDPSIVNMVGHPRRLAGQLSSYFLSRRLDVSILTNASYTGPDFEARRTVRVFDQSSYRKSSASGSFVPNLANWIAHERSADAIFLYPTVTPVLAQEIAQFIAVSSPESVHVPVLLLDVGLAGPPDRPTVVDEETLAQYRSALTGFAAAANRNVILAVPSRTLAAYVRSISPLPVTEVAPPLSIGTAASNTGRVRNANVYELALYLGAAAPYKGFSHLPTVIGRIGAATGSEWANVRVHVQVFGTDSYSKEIAAVAAAVTKAPFASRFSVNNSHLEDADYEASPHLPRRRRSGLRPPEICGQDLWDVLGTQVSRGTSRDTGRHMDGQGSSLLPRGERADCRLRTGGDLRCDAATGNRSSASGEGSDCYRWACENGTANFGRDCRSFPWSPPAR